MFAVRYNTKYSLEARQNDKGNRNLNSTHLFLCPTILHANETPENVLKKFNDSITPYEAKQYLTGLMKAQFERLNNKAQEVFIRYNKMNNYEAQTVTVKEDLQFVFITNIEFVDKKEHGRQDSPVIYEFVKENGQWKIRWRTSGHIILDLFKEISPRKFHTQNYFQVDGKPIMMESAFASYKKVWNNNKETKIISIEFYPFRFQERDIDYLKGNFGPAVSDTDKPTAIASSLRYPKGTLEINLDNNDQIISFCLNWHNFNGEKETYIHCPSPNSFSPEEFIVSDKELKLVTKGNHQTSFGKNLSWNININLPLLKSGL